MTPECEPTPNIPTPISKLIELKDPTTMREKLNHQFAERSRRGEKEIYSSTTNLVIFQIESSPLNKSHDGMVFPGVYSRSILTKISLIG
jgi:hypothetical protein